MRVIPLDGRPHLPDGVRQWQGDSRGRFEGDTLIVETTNFNDKVQFRGSSENLRLIERFKRVDRDTIIVPGHRQRSHELDRFVDRRSADETVR